jgi:hypothetical protein
MRLAAANVPAATIVFQVITVLTPSRTLRPLGYRTPDKQVPVPPIVIQE